MGQIKLPKWARISCRTHRSQHLEPWGIRALHPQSFLSGIFLQEEQVVFAKLEQQAADRGRTLRQLLNILNATVPEFATIVSAASQEKQS